jgi:hypothetical protein
MPAALATLAHLVMSVRSAAENSSGELPTTSAPSCVRRAQREVEGVDHAALAMAHRLGREVGIAQGVRIVRDVIDSGCHLILLGV